MLKKFRNICLLVFTLTFLSSSHAEELSAEIVLHFGISSKQPPNWELWQNLAATLAEEDPEIAQIILDTQLAGANFSQFLEAQDCLYLTYNAVYGDNHNSYLNLGPYMAADPDFNSDDFLPGTLQQAQVNGETLAFPLALKTRVLIYNSQVFDQINLATPIVNWTFTDFTEALVTLKSRREDTGLIPFNPQEMIDLLLLIAANGALPIDYRYDPPVVNLTDEATVTAIRQVLDLKKSDLMAYQMQGDNTIENSPRNGAVRAVTLSGAFPIPDGYQMANFPQGRDYHIVAAGQIEGAYINASSKNADACYRWITTISQHPELLTDVMPARISAIHNPIIRTVQGEDAVAVYQDIAGALTDQRAIHFSTSGAERVPRFLLLLWLGRAFDAYIQDNQDLSLVLANAETKMINYLDCIGHIPLSRLEWSASELLTIETCVEASDAEYYDEWMGNK